MIMQMQYRICTKCIMDTSDPGITFDENGICNHCKSHEETVKAKVRVGEAGKKEFDAIISKIRKDGRNKKYDCLVGVSGGVDSSYLAYKLKDLGLKPLAVHLDNGWNSELAVNNIERLLKAINVDLYTHVIDWEEFKDLQLAFLKASTPDSEIPTDHAILAILYYVAARNNIKYIITAHNVITEGYGVAEWSQGHRDWKYIKSIHKRFGRVNKLSTFPHYGIAKFIYYSFIKRLKTVRLLNYMPYVKKDAMQLLEKEFGWKPYSGKHYESRYTAFYQGHILPTKFGYDKRRCHLSSLIAAKQISREEALKEIKREPYPLDKLTQDREYVIKKLGLTEEEFEKIMRLPKKSFFDYPSYKNMAIFRNKVILSFYHRVLGI